MKEERIIVTTASTFDKMVRTTDIGDRCRKLGFRVVSLQTIEVPFEFESENVVAVVSGNKGDEIFGGKEMDFFPNLKIVTPFGIGYDHIDIEAVKERGIAVTHIPAVSSRSVAELVFGLILSLAHRISECDALMKKGVWDRLLGFNLKDKTLGIMGLGNTGKEVAKMAPVFGMRVIANDIVYDEAFLKEHPYVEQKNFNELLGESDIITLHVPLTEETRHMINKETIKAIKNGVYIINTARGLVVDERALLDALNGKKVAGAALEVFSKEPPFSNRTLKELITHPRVVATAHLATFTPEVQYAVASRVLDNIVFVLEGRIEDADFVG